MKNTARFRISLMVLVILLAVSAAAQITPLQDAYTNSGSPSTNYGSATTLSVTSARSIQTTYIQFDLSSVPAGYTGANVVNASLKLYVDSVTAGGSFNIDYVNGTWGEKTITANLAPALGNSIAVSVPITSANAKDYVIINLTTALQSWLNGAEPNDGIALVPNSGLNISLDSKENTNASHPAELDVVYTNGATMSGVTTGSGSGLTGGGTSGSISLSLVTNCAANQILEWNGSLWACANLNSGGTITGVTAGAGLAGGATSGNATLSVDPTQIPFLNVANTFMQSQTVNGNLSATGIVTGSGFQIGSNLFDYGSYANGNAFLGFAGNTTTNGYGNTASGFEALYDNANGADNTASGFLALYANTSGLGNTAIGTYALNFSTTASGNTADGFEALQYTTGSYNTGLGTYAGIPTNSQNATGASNTYVGYNANPGAQPALNNSTALGANAQVAQSNALVLGSINGVNGATADTAVGIGTTTPLNTPLAGNPPTVLNIVGNSTYVPLVVQSPSTFGTWAVLNNTSSGGKPWAILSAASGNSEGAGNLAITDFGVGGTIFLEGNVQVSGNLSKGGGSFKIDHPLDPANKYLSHSFVESPDMMNVYNGNARTDGRGLAVVTLPGYFEALNRDFRYQLTVIGQFAQAIVAKEISHNCFTIRTNRPGVKVSWQVTGIRHDAFADAHRIPNEEEKPRQERGRYLHPELFGASPEQAIGRRPLPVSQKDEVETAQMSWKRK